MTPLEQASVFLPGKLRTAVFSALSDTEELHLRVGRPLTAASGDGRERPILLNRLPVTVTADDIRMVLELATCASYHTAVQRLCQGFLPLKGGHRLGIVGSAAMQDGRIIGMQQISSLCLRIAHPVHGIGADIAERLFSPVPSSALILSPPGMGKTTLLRELIRIGSSEYRLRIGLADERSEVAAMWKGVPQLDVGDSTDVMDGCPKGAGLLLLLRSMSPQLLAMDEITASEDVDALSMAANCGVPVLAAAHGSSLKELWHRPLYRRLLEEQLFRQVVLIERSQGRRAYRMEEISDE